MVKVRRMNAKDIAEFRKDVAGEWSCGDLFVTRKCADDSSTTHCIREDSPWASNAKNLSKWCEDNAPSHLIDDEHGHVKNEVYHHHGCMFRNNDKRKEQHDKGTGHNPYDCIPLNSGSTWKSGDSRKEITARRIESREFTERSGPITAEKMSQITQTCIKDWRFKGAWFSDYNDGAIFFNDCIENNSQIDTLFKSKKDEKEYSPPGKDSEFIVTK